MLTLQIVDKRVYQITEADISEFHEEEGWYVDITYSDEKVDTYGPYNTHELASSAV
jgi:hypothetical protein